MKTKTQIEERIDFLQNQVRIAVGNNNHERAERLDIEVDTLMWVLEEE